MYVRSVEMPTNRGRCSFDGQDLSKWQTTGPFTVKDGILVAQSGGGNAISKFEYADFELELEWKIGRLGNTGVYYREEATQEIAPGNEYQILDDQAYLERQPPTMQTGSLYEFWLRPKLHPNRLVSGTRLAFGAKERG